VKRRNAPERAPPFSGQKLGQHTSCFCPPTPLGDFSLVSSECECVNRPRLDVRRTPVRGHSPYQHLLIQNRSDVAKIPPPSLLHHMMPGGNILPSPQSFFLLLLAFTDATPHFSRLITFFACIFVRSLHRAHSHVRRSSPQEVSPPLSFYRASPSQLVSEPTSYVLSVWFPSVTERDFVRSCRATKRCFSPLRSLLSCPEAFSLGKLLLEPNFIHFSISCKLLFLLFFLEETVEDDNPDVRTLG